MSKNSNTTENIWDWLEVFSDNKTGDSKIPILHFIYGTCHTQFESRIKQESSKVLKGGVELDHKENKVLFMSYGKPVNYEVNSSSPVYFYFELIPNEIKEAKVFPFETGKFLEDKYKEFKHIDDVMKEEVLSKYFEAECLDKKKLGNFVGILYGDNLEYYDCKINNRAIKDKPVNPYVVNFFKGIGKDMLKDMKDYGGIDWNLSTIELQYFEKIDFENDKRFRLKYIMCEEGDRGYFKEEFQEYKELQFVTYSLASYERMTSQHEGMAEYIVYLKGREIIQGNYV